MFQIIRRILNTCILFLCKRMFFFLLLQMNILNAAASSQRGSEGSIELDFASPLQPPKSHLLKVFWILYFPFTLLFALTIPNCQKKKCRKWFPVTFVISTLYITLASYILVWMITVIGGRTLRRRWWIIRLAKINIYIYIAVTGSIFRFYPANLRHVDGSNVSVDRCYVAGHCFVSSCGQEGIR